MVKVTPSRYMRQIGYPIFRMPHRGVYLAKFMDIRPIINLGRLVVFFLFIIFVIFSRTSMLRDNPLSGILG